jgi:hypothetical protein
MNFAEHKKRHQSLHNSLDELVADYLNHNICKIPSQTVLTDLMKWSYNQTLDPTELKSDNDGLSNRHTY